MRTRDKTTDDLLERFANAPTNGILRHELERRLALANSNPNRWWPLRKSES